jgi:lipopolysaccharide transport system ATP-binding protein
VNGAPIKFDSVWKGYPLWPTGQRTLRAVASRRSPLFLRSAAKRWALKDVSFEVAAGQSVGLIGGNGAGKSTLLRLAAGLGAATRGSVRVDERAAAVLSLGDTLHPSLTGSENAITAAVVAGLTRAEARRRLPEMLAFAELEDVADAPLRTYSDGMKLRLAFSVVAQLEPHVLLVDEVLAVGDLRFQAKCLERVRELRDRGTTVLMASHDLSLVRRECGQVAWLNAGHVMAYGDADEVVDDYEEAARERARAATPPPTGDGPLRLGDNRVGTQEATIAAVEVAPELESGDALAITLRLSTRAVINDPIVSIAIRRRADDALCCELDTRMSGVSIGRLEGDSSVTLAFDRLDLAPGEHAIDVGLYSADWETVFDYHWHNYVLHVHGPGGVKGALRPPHGWQVG